MTEQEKSQIAAVATSVEHVIDGQKQIDIRLGRMEGLSHERHDATQKMITGLSERVAMLEQHARTDRVLIGAVGEQTRTDALHNARADGRVEQQRIGLQTSLVLLGIAVTVLLAIAATTAELWPVSGN